MVWDFEHVAVADSSAGEPFVDPGFFDISCKNKLFTVEIYCRDQREVVVVFIVGVLNLIGIRWFDRDRCSAFTAKVKRQRLRHIFRLNTGSFIGCNKSFVLLSGAYVGGEKQPVNRYS